MITPSLSRDRHGKFRVSANFIAFGCILDQSQRRATAGTFEAHLPCRLYQVRREMPSASHGRGSSIFGRPRPVALGDCFGVIFFGEEAGGAPSSMTESLPAIGTDEPRSDLPLSDPAILRDRVANVGFSEDASGWVGAGHGNSDAMVTPGTSFKLRVGRWIRSTGCGRLWPSFTTGPNRFFLGSPGYGSVHGFFVMAQKITCAMAWHN